VLNGKFVPEYWTSFQLFNFKVMSNKFNVEFVSYLHKKLFPNVKYNHHAIQFSFVFYLFMC
jgi:hypothetical protein